LSFSVILVQELILIVLKAPFRR